MKAAFTIWNGRIAPVFDVAHRVRILEVDSGRIVREGDAELPDGPPGRIAGWLAERGVHLLVCGAVSRPVRDMVTAQGVRVIAFVAGDLREVVQAWMSGTLESGAFAMPGCRAWGRRRRLEGNRGIEEEGNPMQDGIDSEGVRGAHRGRDAWAGRAREAPAERACARNAGTVNRINAAFPALGGRARNARAR